MKDSIHYTSILENPRPYAKSTIDYFINEFAATSHSQKVREVENSVLAKIVAKINGEELYAITFGKNRFH
jgi:hypothetical protein